MSANRRPDVAPRKDPLPMFPPEIGRPEKPRPPTGAYPSQIFGLSLWAPFPKIFWGIFFSGVLGFPDARPVERGRHPVYAGRGPGDLFSDFLVPARDPFPIFLDSPMRSARQAIPSPPTPPATNLLTHVAREGRTTNRAGDDLTRQLKLFCR